MRRLLITFDKNYADEFDVSGFDIWDEERWFNHLKNAEVFFAEREAKHDAQEEARRIGTSQPAYFYKRDLNIERYFGTNEAVQFRNFNDYQESFSVKEISTEEEAVIRKFFPQNRHFGHFLALEIEGDDPG